MQNYCFLLMLFAICCYLSRTTGTIEKRELLPSDRNMFKELRNQLTALEKRLDKRTCKDDVGFTYTRWGRTTCPKSVSELVYSGYTGGSYFKHTGGAAEHLCMSGKPDWDNLKVQDGVSGSKGYVYGTEYETWGGSIGIGKSHFNYDVPCAVCRTVGSTSVLMIPGQTKCNTNWTKQYSGYLMTNSYKYAAAGEYLCVDKNAERIPGTHASKDGNCLYAVEGRCGSLPCPPYRDGRELGCVVCSK